MLTFMANHFKDKNYIVEIIDSLKFAHFICSGVFLLAIIILCIMIRNLRKSNNEI